ncbi:MAG: CoA pyrophosphatase [Proteobacteria bacterium]|nr:CoA pyrophosphatase [Pseudomonadota bacterium]
MNYQILQEYLNKRERQTISENGYKPASILIPLTENGRIYILLTKRAKHLTNHPGEISFPGGRFDLSDENRLQTALREVEEEIGIPRYEVNVIGALDDAISITNFHIVPYVGIIPFFCPYHYNKSEIDEIILIPLAFFLNEPKHEIYEKGSIRKENFIYIYEDKKIFGLTAFLLKSFVKILEESGFLKINSKLIF